MRPLSIFLTLLLSAIVCGCAKGPPAPPRPSARAPASALTRIPVTTSAASAPRDSRGEGSATVASVLSEIHRRLPLAAPSPGLRHLVFGSGFLVQLREADVRLIDSTSGSVIVSVPLNGPRGAVALPGGSVLVCATDASYRFDPGQQRPHRLTRVSLLPNSLLEPSRESGEHVWVIETSLRDAIRYTFAEKEFGVEGTRELPDYDGGALTTLLDGAFLYASPSGLVRLFAGRSTSYQLPRELGRPWRLLPAERVDRAWYVTAAGEAFLLELAGRARVVRKFAVSDAGGPFDFAAITDVLALVQVREFAKEPRSFVLNLYSTTGTRTKSYSLATLSDSEAANENWAERASRNREVTISQHPPRVAVGGSTQLRLFDLTTGDEIVVP